MAERATSAARPSMADVGRLANVSTQTVSRYFTGVGYVREETRDKIARAIEELGYRRNHSARNFRRQQMNTVGVLSMGPLNYGSSEILTGLSLAARAEGLTLTITQLDLSSDLPDRMEEVRRALDHLLSIPVDGVVVLTPFSGAEDVLLETAGQTPLIAISDRTTGTGGVASAHSGLAATQATQHLVDQGHRQILHLAGPRGQNEAVERERGYLEALASAGLEPRVMRLADDWTSRSGFRAAQQVAEPFTAVFAANDEIALGFLSGMEERGRRAPDHYSIVGIDDMPSAAYFSPPLTTVRLDFRRLGTVAFDELLRQLRTASPAAHCGVEPELVVRRSTRVVVREDGA